MAVIYKKRRKKPKKSKHAGRPTVWENRMYIDSFLLAREGMPDVRIAQTLGMAVNTFVKLKKRDTALQYALKRAREPIGGDRVVSGNPVVRMKDFIVGQLPPKLRKVFDTLTNDDDPTLTTKEKLRRMVLRSPRHQQQALFLNAWVANNFDRTKTCRQVGISLDMFDDWMEKDPDFIRMLEIVRQAKKDFFSSKLVELAEQGDKSAILFGNKTLNSDEYALPSKKVEVTGKVDHRHRGKTIQELKLSLDTRKELLQAMRGSPQIEEGPRQVSILDSKTLGD